MGHSALLQTANYGEVRYGIKKLLTYYYISSAWS